MATFTPDLCRMARAALGLSIKEAAKKIGIHHNTLQKYEANSEGGYDMILKIRRYFENNKIVFLDPDPSEDYGYGPGIRLVQDLGDITFIDYWKNRIWRLVSEPARTLKFETCLDTSVNNTDFLERLTNRVSSLVISDIELNGENEFKTISTLVNALRQAAAIYEEKAIELDPYNEFDDDDQEVLKPIAYKLIADKIEKKYQGSQLKPLFEDLFPYLPKGVNLGTEQRTFKLRDGSFIVIFLDKDTDNYKFGIQTIDENGSVIPNTPNLEMAKNEYPIFNLIEREINNEKMSSFGSNIAARQLKFNVGTLLDEED